MSDSLETNLPAQAAAGATIITPISEVPLVSADHIISHVRLTSPSLVTGVATNNATINVRRWRGGVLQETSAAITLAAGVNLPAETQVELPVTGSPYVLPGDLFDAQQVQNGTGLALPAGISCQVEIS